MMREATNSIELAHQINSLERYLLPHVAFLYIAPSIESRPTQTIHAGTGSLIRVGKYEILVTCAHVYDGYLQERSNHAEAILGLLVVDEGSTIELHDSKAKLRCIERGTVDLAVFQYSGLDRHESSSKRYLSLNLSANVQVTEGQTIVFTGFPGYFRKAFGCQAIVSAVSVPLQVSHVTDSTIIAGGRENEEVFQQLGERFGGFSGSIVYTFSGTGELMPVGFVTEWAGLAGGLLRITPITKLADLLRHSKNFDIE